MRAPETYDYLSGHRVPNLPWVLGLSTMASSMVREQFEKNRTTRVVRGGWSDGRECGASPFLIESKLGAYILSFIGRRRDVECAES